MLGDTSKNFLNRAELRFSLVVIAVLTEPDRLRFR